MFESLNRVSAKDRILILDVAEEFDRDGGERYFLIGHDWYASKFLSCITERMFFFYSAAVLAICLLIIYPVFHTILPLNVSFPIVGNNSDVNSIMTVLKVEHSGDISPAVSIARYLVAQYVINRETYNYYEIGERKEYILNSSTSTARLQYESDYLDIHNPNSMLLRNQITGRRSATIKEIKFVANYDGDPYQAIVLAEILDHVGTKQQTTLLVNISVQFDMPNLQLVHMGYIPFFFKVSQYKVLDSTAESK